MAAHATSTPASAGEGSIVPAAVVEIFDLCTLALDASANRLGTMLNVGTVDPAAYDQALRETRGYVRAARRQAERLMGRAR